MLTFFQVIPFCFAALFPVLNPLGCVLIFLAYTEGLTAQVKKKIAFKIFINTVILLITVLLLGTWILRLFGITIPIVQIAGGLIVSYIGWTLLQQPNSANNPIVVIQDDKAANELAFFPLTMPITAGPGCIAVTLTIGAHEVHHTLQMTIMAQAGAIVGIILVALSVFFSYAHADQLVRLVGSSGKQVIIRLAAFINICIGLQIIWGGVQVLLNQ